MNQVGKRGKRAAKYSRTLTPRQARVYRDEPKQLVDGSLSWFDDERGVARHLDAAVMCGDQFMEIVGIDRKPGDVNLRISIPDVYGNIGRLCWTPDHGDDVHWHWYDHMVGNYGSDESVQMGTPSRELMTRLFVERLRITGQGVFLQ